MKPAHIVRDAKAAHVHLGNAKDRLEEMRLIQAYRELNQAQSAVSSILLECGVDATDMEQ